MQAEEIVRRCLCGYSPAMALQTSNPIKMPPGKGGKPAAGGSVRITSEHVRNLKHDVEFIKKAHDLRDVGEGKKKGNAKAAPPRWVRCYPIPYFFVVARGNSNLAHLGQMTIYCRSSFFVFFLYPPANGEK